MKIERHEFLAIKYMYQGGHPCLAEILLLQQGFSRNAVSRIFRKWSPLFRFKRREFDRKEGCNGVKKNLKKIIKNNIRACKRVAKKGGLDVFIGFNFTICYLLPSVKVRRIISKEKRKYVTADTYWTYLFDKHIPKPSNASIWQTCEHDPNIRVKQPIKEGGFSAKLSPETWHCLEGLNIDYTCKPENVI